MNLKKLLVWSAGAVVAGDAINRLIGTSQPGASFVDLAAPDIFWKPLPLEHSWQDEQKDQKARRFLFNSDPVRFERVVRAFVNEAAKPDDMFPDGDFSSNEPKPLKVRIRTDTLFPYGSTKASYISSSSKVSFISSEFADALHWVVQSLNEQVAARGIQNETMFEWLPEANPLYAVKNVLQNTQTVLWGGLPNKGTIDVYLQEATPIEPVGFLHALDSSRRNRLLVLAREATQYPNFQRRQLLVHELSHLFLRAHPHELMHSISDQFTPSDQSTPLVVDVPRPKQTPLQPLKRGIERMPKTMSPDEVAAEAAKLNKEKADQAAEEDIPRRTLWFALCHHFYASALTYATECRKAAPVSLEKGDPFPDFSDFYNPRSGRMMLGELEIYRLHSKLDPRREPQYREEAIKNIAAKMIEPWEEKRKEAMAGIAERREQRLERRRQRLERQEKRQSAAEDAYGPLADVVAQTLVSRISSMLFKQLILGEDSHASPEEALEAIYSIDTASNLLGQFVGAAANHLLSIKDENLKEIFAGIATSMALSNAPLKMLVPELLKTVAPPGISNPITEAVNFASTMPNAFKLGRDIYLGKPNAVNNMLLSAEAAILANAIISIVATAAVQFAREMDKHVQALARYAKERTISPEMKVSGELSEEDRAAIRKHCGGKDIEPTPASYHEDTKIRATPIKITARGTVLFHQLDKDLSSHLPLVYELTLPRLKTLGRGDVEDIQRRIDNGQPVHFWSRALGGAIGHHEQARRNAATYSSPSSHKLQPSGKLSEGDLDAIEHETKGHDNKPLQVAVLHPDEAIQIKGIPFHITSRGTVLFRQDASMVDEDPKQRDVIEVPIGRLKVCADKNVGEIRELLSRIERRQHLTFRIRQVDEKALAALTRHQQSEGKVQTVGTPTHCR